MRWGLDGRFSVGAGVLLLFILFLPFTSGQDIPSAESISGADSFHVNVVSPLDGEKVSGRVVIIVSPAQPDVISSVTLSIARENGDEVFSESLSSSANWSTSWDSSTVENGPYTFSVEGCSINGCGAREWSVVVQNTPPQTDTLVSEPASSPKTVEIFPSTMAGAFFLYADEETLTSSGDALVVPPASYAAKLLLFDSFVREISSPQFNLNHDDVFAAVEMNSLPKNIFISNQEYVPTSSVVIRAGFDGDYTLHLQPSSKTLAACASFDEPSSSCAVDWEILPQDEYSLSLRASSFVAVVDASPVDSSEPSPIPPVEKVVLSLPPQADSFSIFTRDGALVETSSADVSVLPGTYHVRVDYSQLPVRSIFLRDVEVNENTSFLTVSSGIDSFPIPAPRSANWLNGVAIHPFVDFSSGEVVYHSTPPADAFFYCPTWDFSTNECASSFEDISPEPMSVSASVASENADVLEDISLPPGISPRAVILPLSPHPSAFAAASLPRSLRVEQSIDSFSANDLPFVNVFTSSANDTPSDILFDAFLTNPDGETFSIPSANIRKKNRGEFDVSAFRPRSFRPGLYTISVRPRGGASDTSSAVSPAPSSLSDVPLPATVSPADESISFYWGLLALNTSQSIYQPGHTAAFELVVLDRASFGVPHATVSLEITSPSGETTLLSTSDAGVVETTSPGIYLASFPVKEEGTYSLRAHASADGIDTQVLSSFDVRSSVAFDVIRRTLTKMDPAYQPVKMQLNIVPRDSRAKTVSVREFLPASFEVDTGMWVTRGDELGDAVTTWEPDPRVHVSVVGDTKIIEWSSVELDSLSGATLSYSYTVPLLKPWLYLAGPLQIQDALAPDAASLFEESRSWMIAVDDSNTAVFHFSKLSFFTPSEPTPNDAVSDSVFIGTPSQGIYGMHPTFAGLNASRRISPGTTSSGTYHGNTWVSPPLAAQTIASGVWIVYLWGYENGIAADLTPITTLWGWADANDSRLGPIQASPITDGELGLTPPSLRTYTDVGASITLSRKDKVVVEIDLNGLTPASGAFADLNWDGVPYDMNVIFASPIQLYRQFNIPSINLPSTDNNTGLVTNDNFLVESLSSCDGNFFDCANADINLQWCAGTGCSNWADVNASSGSIQLVSGSNPDVNTITSANTDISSWVVKAVDTGTYELRVTNSGAFVDTNTSSGTNRTITISSPTSTNTIVLNSPSKYSARYAGGSASDFLGRTFARSLTVIGDVNYDQNVPLYNAVQILNMDNGAYANDLFIPAALADINSKTNAGALYIIQNADSKFGDKYLVNSDSYTYQYSGSSANDLLTFAGQPTPGYYLKDTDGNGYTNDLLILASQADYTASNAGTLYYIRDIDTKAAGNYDLNNSTFFTARFDGWKANDFLGDSFDSGEAVRVGNFDGNNVDNDLVISIPRSDSLSTDNGLIAVYKDFNKLSGVRTVNTTTPSWYARGGHSWASDFIGGKTLGPPGFQILNLDGNSFSNDLAILVPSGAVDDCDTVANSNWGFVYIYKDFTRRSTNGNLDSLCNLPGSAGTADYFFYDTGTATNFGRTGDRNNSFTTWDVNGNGILSDVLFYTPSYSTNAGSVWFQKSLYRQTPSTFVSASVTLNFTGAVNEWLGFTDDSGPAVQMVNVDANSSSNDMLVNCPLCDGSNFISRTNSGNISITQDLNRIATAVSTSHRIMNTGSVNRLRGSRYIGSRAGDQIGDTNGSGDGVFLVDMDGDGMIADLFIAGSSIDAPATDTGAVYWIQDANDFVTGGGEFSASGFYLYEFDLNKDTNYTARWSTPTAYDRLSDTNRSHDSAPKVVNLDNGSTSNDLIMAGSYIDINGKTDAGALYIVLNANTKSGNQDLSNASNYTVMFNGAASNEYLGLNVYGGKGYQVVNIDGNSYANDLLISAARASENGTLTGALYIILDADTKTGALDLNNSNNYYRKYVGGAASDYLTSTLHSGEGAQLVNLDNSSTTNDLLLTSVQADVNSLSDAGAVYWVQNIFTAPQGGGGNDYSFALLLPSSGCTNGKGNISGGTACQRLYWEPTDLTGVSDENQVNPEGQTSNVPFLVYDNQSSSSSDLNILLDLNAALPSTHIVKVSRIYAGWAFTCTGNTDSNCLTLSSSAVSAGKASYSTGTQDLNLFIWTDFNAGSVGQLDRNLDSNSVASS